MTVSFVNKLASGIVVVQLLSCVWLFATPRPAARQASLSFHYLPEFAPTPVHWVSDTSYPCHPLSPPASPALSLSQHQGLFQWVSSLHQVAKILELQCQHQSFQWVFRTDFLYDGLVGSPCSPQDSQESSPTLHSSTASKIQHSVFLWSNSHFHIWLLEKPVLTTWTLVGKVMSLLFNMLSRMVIAFIPRS